MVSVAFHGLVLKYNSMLKRTVSSYKRCADVVNTRYSITFSSVFYHLDKSFLWLFSEPSSISVSIGNYGCQNWICFSNHAYIYFRERFNYVLEAVEKDPFRSMCSANFTILFLH